MDDEFHNHRGPAAKRAELERSCSFFDLRHNETGQWLPRPGKEARPETNAANIQDSFLRVVSWRGEDRCPTPWPNRIYLWPNFEQTLWKGGVINDVPWAAAMPIIRNNTVFSDFAYKAGNLSPARTFSYPQGSQPPPPRTLPAGAPLQQVYQSASLLQSGHPRSVRLPHRPKHSLLAKATGQSMRMKAREQNANPNNRSEVGFDVEMHDADDSGLVDADYESDPDYASSSRGFGNRRADDDDAMKEDSDETYAVEALVDHRPPFSSRRNARAYKSMTTGLD
ncbi:hypothetical protein DL770_007018 [Monosporascus sp. CRB-9-2]|nr:hypothetical protein DL770_007018 [Monosporascus sp. CRB-9-2]